MGLYPDTESLKYRVYNILLNTVVKEFDTRDEALEYFKAITFKRDFKLERLTYVSSTYDTGSSTMWWNVNTDC